MQADLSLEAEEGKEGASQREGPFGSPRLPQSLESTETSPKLKKGFGSKLIAQG